MKSEYVGLDDARVTAKSTWPGRVYRLDGSESHPDISFPHELHLDGRHVEPRMNSVMAPFKTWNYGPGDFAEIEVEDISLLGIALELAEHHYDIDLFIDGVDIHSGFGCVSAYMPSSDGFGKIHWLMFERGKHHVRMQIAEKYNRILDNVHIKPTHACINGFVLIDELRFPPPLYNSWMFSQDDMPSDIRGRKGSLKAKVIPAGGYLYLMDLHGQGTLDTLAFHLDHPLILEVLDGGVAQAEFPLDFPSWIRRVDLSDAVSGAMGTVVDVATAGDGHVRINMLKPITFGSRLIVRLLNQNERDIEISHMYMEGTLKCM